MTITLTAIRYHTADEGYHYTIDNQPLEDLEENDLILKAAIDSINNYTSISTASGSWTNLQTSIDVHSDLGKPLAYKVKVWATEDTTQTSLQNSRYSEDLVVGYNALNGNVVIQQVTSLINQSIGTDTLVLVYTGGSNSMALTFSGYSGSHGYVLVKAERFGII